MSGKWNSQFNWQLVVGLVSGFEVSAGVIIGDVAGVESGLLTTGITFFLMVISLLLETVYLLHLNRSIKICSA